MTDQCIARNGEPCDCETPGDWHRVANDFQQKMFASERQLRAEAVNFVTLLEGLRCDGYSPHHAECIALRDRLCVIAGDELPAAFSRFLPEP